MDLSEFLEPGEEGLVITTSNSREEGDGRVFVYQEGRFRSIPQKENLSIWSPVSHNGSLVSLTSNPINGSVMIRDLLTGMIFPSHGPFTGIFSQGGELFGVKSNDDISLIHRVDVEPYSDNVVSVDGDISSVLPIADNKLVVKVSDGRSFRAGVFDNEKILQIDNLSRGRFIHDFSMAEGVRVLGDKYSRDGRSYELVMGGVEKKGLMHGGVGSIDKVTDPLGDTHHEYHGSEGFVIHEAYSRLANYVNLACSMMNRGGKPRKIKPSDPFWRFHYDMPRTIKDVKSLIPFRGSPNPNPKNLSYFVGYCAEVTRVLENNYGVRHPTRYNGKLLFSSTNKYLFDLSNSQRIHRFNDYVTGMVVITGDLLDKTLGSTNMRMGSRRRARVIGMPARSGLRKVA